MTDLSNFDPTGSEEFMAAQKAHVAEVAAAEEARRAAVERNNPRVLSSGGAHDGDTVYPSEFTLEYDTKEEALAAIDAARADGRHVSVIADNGDFVVETGDGWSASIELDPSTRYPLADHTGGR